jgi:hypothetical protein
MVLVQCAIDMCSVSQSCLLRRAVRHLVPGAPALYLCRRIICSRTLHALSVASVVESVRNLADIAWLRFTLCAPQVVADQPVFCVDVGAVTLRGHVKEVRTSKA